MTQAEAVAAVRGLHPTARCTRRRVFVVEVPGPHHTVAQYGRGPTESLAWLDAARRVLAIQSRGGGDRKPAT